LGQFKDVGTVALAKSGKSYHIIYSPPYSVFKDNLFIPRRALKDVEDGLIKWCKVYLREPDKRNESCEKKGDL